MKKWYDEEYRFSIEVTGFLRGDHTEHLCRNGEEIGDKYTCTYGCPVNEHGYGMVKDYVCPDGCVCFRMTVEKTGAENFYKGKYYEE